MILGYLWSLGKVTEMNCFISLTEQPLKKKTLFEKWDKMVSSESWFQVSASPKHPGGSTLRVSISSTYSWDSFSSLTVAQLCVTLSVLWPHGATQRKGGTGGYEGGTASLREALWAFWTAPTSWAQSCTPFPSDFHFPLCLDYENVGREYSLGDCGLDEWMRVELQESLCFC